MTFLELRRMAREHYPAASRAMRARWVLAKMRAPLVPRVQLSAAREFNPDDYFFRRLCR